MCGSVYVFLYVSERNLGDRGTKIKCGEERESLAEREGESERRERARESESIPHYLL